MSMENAPRSERLHIGIFGRRNAGKSSLVNALTDQKVSLVSDVAGTTTDPVLKTMELHGLGPVVFIDTPGFDDEGELGSMRVERTRESIEKTDLAIVLVDADLKLEKEWIALLKEKNIPLITVLNKCDALTDPMGSVAEVKAAIGEEPLLVSAENHLGIDLLREKIIEKSPENFWETSITGDLVKEKDLVLLVMPQDIEAPRGRLILPQVQTIRELLDKKCAVMSCTADTLDITLEYLGKAPKLIITDSQAFKEVYPKVPEGSLLTSFSILFAGYKGDVKAFLKATESMATLKDGARILVAEACSHPPAGEDIGRNKIPKLIRKKYGENIAFDFVRGNDFPADLKPYDLIIHCGACMFNRKHVMNRLKEAEKQGVPMCNYGFVLASLNGILDKVVYA